MSNFNKSILVILKHECPNPTVPVGGGYVNDPDDLGGVTCYGISMLMVSRENITAEELGIPDLNPESFRLMTLENAKKIYKKYFWDRYGYGNINNDVLATKVFDIAVNCGAFRSAKIVQQAASECGNVLKMDGVLGPKSFSVINSCKTDELLTAICKIQKAYYEYIAAKRPQNKKFLKGWLKRASWRG